MVGDGEMKGGAVVEDVMGWEVDAKKFHQSVTLFYLAAGSVGMSEVAGVLSAILDEIWSHPYTGQSAREDGMTVTRWAKETVTRSGSASASGRGSLQ